MHPLIEAGVYESHCLIRSDLEYPIWDCDSVPITSEWNSTATETCSRHVFDDSVFESTVVTEFDLVCERNYLKSLAASIESVIYGFGSLTVGYVSDAVGRKKVIALALVVCVTMNIASTFATTYVTYLVCYIISS